MMLRVSLRVLGNSYAIEIACDFACLGSATVGTDFGLTRCRRVSQQPHDSVRLDHSGSIVVRSRRSIETKDFAYALDRGPGNGEEMHSRNKQMIATAVGRRGKWRTLWRGVKTKPGR